MDGDNSAQISIAAKNMVTHDDYDYGVQANYMLFSFFIFSLLSLCYQCNQKTGVALFDNFNIYDLRLNLGMPKLVCPNLVYQC